MRSWHLAFAFCLSGIASATPLVEGALVQESVYVETTLDTDQDGQLDRIYAEVTRTRGETDLPTIYTISPYALGGNDVANHDVDVALLPQDGRLTELDF